jgi:hypothetical protein
MRSTNVFEIMSSQANVTAKAARRLREGEGKVHKLTVKSSSKVSSDRAHVYTEQVKVNQ